MTDRGNGPEGENKPHVDRMAALRQASLRILEDLDVPGVLRGVVESSRLLTGAGYGAFLGDEGESGLPPLTVSGDGCCSPDSDQLERARGDDLRALSQAFDPLGDGERACLVVPVAHDGSPLGRIFVAGKESGGRFTLEDEEALAFLAAMAGPGLKNARRFEEERKVRAEMEALVDASPTGVMVFDARTWALVRVNDEARRIAGGLEIQGESLSDLLAVFSTRRPDGQDIALEELPLFRVMTTGQTVRAEEMVVVLPDGREAFILVNLTPVFGEDGEIASVVATVQDMGPIEESHRLRAEFVGMAGDELRDPLATIKGCSSMALGALDRLGLEESRRLLRMIDRQADHMQEIINSLLDYSLLESGGVTVDAEPVNVSDVVDRAVAAFQGRVPGVPVEVDLETGLPTVRADPPRMVQVLSNLCSYLAGDSLDSPTVRVTGALQGPLVSLSVSGAGNGSVPADTARVLERAPCGRGEGPVWGNRMSLAICKGIVESHGGRIAIDDLGPGLGVRISFTVPAALGMPPDSQEPAGSSLSRPVRDRVVVLESDPRVLQNVRRGLARAGFAPVIAVDGGEVERVVAERNPRAVLLDLAVAREHDFILLEQVQELTGAPVMVLARQGEEELVRMALDIGASDYLVVPFADVELETRVRALTRRHSDELAAHPLGFYRLGELTVDYGRRAVESGGSLVALTPLEYRLLVELSSKSGKVLTVEELVEQLWGPSKSQSAQSLRTLVASVRQKLGDDARNPRYIFTHSRVGYRMPPSEAPGTRR